MIQQIQIQFLIGCRVLLESILNAAGMFRLAPLFRGQPAQRKRIAFQAYSIHLAQQYQTIIAELLKAPDEYEVVFILLPHPHFSRKSLQQLREFARSQLHIPVGKIHFSWQVLWEKFDLVVYNDVFAKFLLRKSQKCLLQHGIMINHRWLKPRLFRKTAKDFDIILLNDESDIELIRAHYHDKFATPKMYHIGMPYLDRLSLLDEDSGHYLRELAPRRQKVNVLFAPSWSGLNLLENQGRDYVDRVMAILTQMDLNTVVKLHACSYNKIMAGGIDWKKQLQKFAGYENVMIDYDVDDIPALKYCDVLITDISSRAFNFMLLDKPVIYYFPTAEVRNTMDANRIAQLKQNAFTAASPENIREILQQLTANGSGKSSANSTAGRLMTGRSDATKAAVHIMVENMNHTGAATA